MEDCVLPLEAFTFFLDMGSLHVFSLSTTLKDTDSVSMLFYSYCELRLAPEKCGLLLSLELQGTFNIDPAH